MVACFKPNLGIAREMRGFSKDDCAIRNRFSDSHSERVGEITEIPGSGFVFEVISKELALYQTADEVSVHNHAYGSFETALLGLLCEKHNIDSRFADVIGNIFK